MIEEHKRIRIINLYYSGQSKSNLAKLMGVSRNSVRSIIDAYEVRGTVNHAHIPGRPRVTTPEEDEELISAAEHSTAPIRKLSAQIKYSGTRPSLRTSYRRVQEGGLYSGVQRRKDIKLQDLTVQNERYGWACETLAEWTAFSCSSRIYVDECTVNSCTAYKRREWRRRGEKEGRGIQFVRGCGWNSVSMFGGLMHGELLPLHISVGKFTGSQYKHILQEKYLPILREKFQTRAFVWQQDNAPVHTSRVVSEYVEAVPEWERAWTFQPAYSPDLNPIENVWARL